MDEFLAKPVSVRALYRKIVAVIEKRRDFVKATRYFGPDRRRHRDGMPPRQKRRKSDQELSAIRSTERIPRVPGAFSGPHRESLLENRAWEG